MLNESVNSPLTLSTRGKVPSFMAARSTNGPIPGLDLDFSCTGSLSTSAAVLGAAQVLPEVVYGVHVGSHRDVWNADDVAERGITAFLCVASEVDPPFPPFVSGQDVAAGTVLCKHVKLEDAASTQLQAHCNEVFGFIDVALETNHRVVVYCERGVSRSVSFVVAYVMRAANLPWQDALQHVRHAYPKADPNFAFINQLVTLRMPPTPSASMHSVAAISSCYEQSEHTADNDAADDDDDENMIPVQPRVAAP